MKRFYILCMTAMMLLTVTCSAVPEETEAAVRKAKSRKAYQEAVRLRRRADKARDFYRRLLSDLLVQWGADADPSNDVYFLCDDMNDDGVPELFLQYGSNPKAEGAQRIYVFRNGKAKCVYKNEDGKQMLRYYPQSKVLMEKSDKMGWTLTRYYKMSGKAMVLCAQAQEPARYMVLSYGGVYNIRNKSTSKSGYNKYVRRLTKRKSGKNIVPVANTLENISAKL